MPTSAGDRDRHISPSEAKETAAAARDARAIGGRPADPELAPAQRPLAEGGEGVAEGFELAEQELIEAAEHGDIAVDPLADGFAVEAEPEPAVGRYGEADHEDSAEVPDSDR